MNKSHEITWARDILGLKDRASLHDIRTAYRELAKKNHPDAISDSRKTKEGRLTSQMHEIAEAYGILLDYCNRYPIPLDQEKKKEHDAEEWWFDRFGNDPLWGCGGN